MSTLIDVINQLNAFGNQADILAAEIALTQLVSVDNPDDKLIEEARKELRKLLVKTDIKKDDVRLAEVAHAGLLVLAELKPMNDIDPVTWDKIEADDRVVASTGQQFSLSSLIGYHNGRPYKDNHLNEFSNSKWLLNPWTRQPFAPMDVEHIQKMALKRENQLIDNLVYNYDKFDNLRLHESVALIRKQMRIEKLKTKEDVPAADAAPAAPADHGAPVIIDEINNADLESLVRMFAAIPAYVQRLDLSENPLGVGIQEADAPRQRAMEGRIDEVEMIRLILARQPVHRHRLFGGAPVEPEAEGRAPAAPRPNSGDNDDDDIYG